MTLRKSSPSRINSANALPGVLCLSGVPAPPCSLPWGNCDLTWPLPSALAESAESENLNRKGLSAVRWSDPLRQEPAQQDPLLFLEDGILGLGSLGFQWKVIRVLMDSINQHHYQWSGGIPGSPR